MDERTKEEMIKIIQSHAQIVQNLQKSYKEEIEKLQKEIKSLKEQNSRLSRQAILMPTSFKYPTIEDVSIYKDLYLRQISSNQITQAFKLFIDAHFKNQPEFQVKGNLVFTSKNKSTTLHQFTKTVYTSYFQPIMFQLTSDLDFIEAKKIKNNLQKSFPKILSASLI